MLNPRLSRKEILIILWLFIERKDKSKKIYQYIGSTKIAKEWSFICCLPKKGLKYAIKTVISQRWPKYSIFINSMLWCAGSQKVGGGGSADVHGFSGSEVEEVTIRWGNFF